MSITETIPVSTFAAASPRRPQDLPAPPAFPAVAAGQLWLLELSVEGTLPPPADRVVGDVNVMIYDRVLTDAVARALPLGSYAEPSGEPKAAAARCVRFARDGWSVVRLLPTGLAPRERTRRVQDIVDELAAAKLPGRLPVMIFAEGADGIEERITARFDELTAIVASFPRDTRLAIVVDAFGGGAAASLHAVAANGLAG